MMMKSIVVFIFAVSVSVQVFAADNPFKKSSNVVVGSSVKWDVKQGVATKTSVVSDKDGTFYQLRVSQSELGLRLLSGATGNAESFDQLTIDDVQLDDKTSTLFLWCLNNQEGHNRFLQQGLKVKQDICNNNGQNGEFVIKFNQDTYNQLKTTKELIYTVKPYRSAVVITFDVSDMVDVFAQISGVSDVAATEKKPVPGPVVTKSATNLTPVAAAPVAKVEPAMLCSIKPPEEFPSIKPVKYVCNDDAAKASARKVMASSISKQQEDNKQLALEEKKKQQLDAERLAREAAEKKAAAAVLLTEQNTNKVRDEVSQKMIGMCQKKWAVGEHRCYCEPYLEFAPAGITSDASCSSK